MKEHILVQIGKQLYNNPLQGEVHFVDNSAANALLNNLQDFPHAFVLACCMDRQTKAERAWIIPFKIKKAFGSFDMNVLANIKLDEYKSIFEANNLHRFTGKMSEVFYRAVQRIHYQYNDDASAIWANSPSSASVVYKFLHFDGVGIKIATMAANILAREFKIPFSDYYSIDVSPDVHVRRVMYRLGLVEKNAENEKIIYKAREMHPKFPGIIDYSLWEIGKTWCRPTNPNCQDCIIASECPSHTNNTCC